MRQNKFPAMPFLSIIAILIVSFLLPRYGFADQWQARIYEKGAPTAMVGVDKKRHIFNYFEKKSPLKLRYSYPCVTGQIAGDKQQINDLRTPEGVYFVEYKIANGLDFKEYGGIAYTLNYPNPVDRLRGKTGHGIWIHSKGFELVPTRGCVAIGLKNIAEVGPMLLPGTPVVLAEELKGATSDNGTLEQLRKLMSEWSKTWAARSEKLFDYYDPEAYTKASENFELFRSNKQRLFKILSFIKIYNREIHALEGPGYWVTWSEQYYTASNLSTEGVRRLYWQKNPQGQFRIVGMEWIPRDLGMRADFQKGQLIAEGPVSTLSDGGSEAPTAPRLDMPEQAVMEKPVAMPVKEEAKTTPETKIDKSLTTSIAELAKNLLAISEPLVPRRQPKSEPPDEITWGIGKKLTEPRDEIVEEAPPATPPAVAPATPEETAPQPVETSKPPIQEQPQPVQQAKPVISDLVLDEATLRDLNNAVSAWNSAYEERDMEIQNLYDQKNFNRLPWKMNVPRGLSLNNVMRIIKQDFDQNWLTLLSRSPSFEVKGPIAMSQCEQMLLGPHGIRQGVQKLWWQKDESGNFKIVGSDFRPRPVGLEGNYLENVSGEISAMIEAWRKAWEGGKLEEYIAFYTPDAVQQGRVNQKNIKRQKEQLWEKVQPATVQLSGLRLAMSNNLIRADMNQLYADSAGHSDKGVKTMLLRFDGNKWLIQKEDWTPASQAAAVRLPIR